MKVVNYLMQTESKHHIPNILSVYIPNILSGNESHMKTYCYILNILTDVDLILF